MARTTGLEGEFPENMTESAVQECVVQLPFVASDYGWKKSNVGRFSMFMAQSVPRVANEETVTNGCASAQSCPWVRNEAMATTAVESLTGSSGSKWNIVEMLSEHEPAQDDQQFAQGPMYFVYAHNASAIPWLRSTCVRRAVQQIESVSIPNNVRKLCDSCFLFRTRLRRVLFGSSTSLERIGVHSFAHSGVQEVSIPDSVRELCYGCFRGCGSLRRVMFGSSSSLERIGTYCFESSGVEEVSIPDSVRELGDRCFKECRSLRRVAFGCSSALEQIGKNCFAGCGLIEFEIPVTVGTIGGGAFVECPLSGGIICGDGCRFCAFYGLVLSRDCERCVSSYGILASVCIPDSVRELSDCCFRSLGRLRRVAFGSSSSLERIGAHCFKCTGVAEMSIPDSVRELGDHCFKACRNLRRVTFGSSSSLERIGFSCFHLTGFQGSGVRSFQG